MRKDFSPLAGQQAAKLRELGAYLQQRRLERGLSLEEVAAETYLSVGKLRAIEAGESDRLPEPVYTRGFLRRFAEAIGLPGAEVAGAFPLEGETRISERRAWDWRWVLEPRAFHLYLLYFLLVLGAALRLSQLTRLPVEKLQGETLGASSPAAVSSGSDLATGEKWNSAARRSGREGKSRP